jgi:hypothetical protein
MHIHKVTYTAEPPFVERNKENIGRVIEELHASGRTDIRYAVFLEEDGKTFVHLVVKQDAKTPGTDSLGAFKKFRDELMASKLETRPASVEMTLVGSSYDML